MISAKVDQQSGKPLVGAKPGLPVSGVPFARHTLVLMVLGIMLKWFTTVLSMVICK